MTYEIPPDQPLEDGAGLAKEADRTERYETQMVESKAAIREAMGAIGKALSLLERVAKDMDQYGDSPLEDLEGT